MHLATPIALVALLAPAAASAQYRDLDTAVSRLQQGFGGGDVDAIMAGVGQGQQVTLQFPGLSDRQGAFGRDQAAYVLDDLLSRVEPQGLELLGKKANRAKGEVLVTARWTIAGGSRELYITLRQSGDQWAVVAIRSA